MATVCTLCGADDGTHGDHVYSETICEICRTCDSCGNILDIEFLPTDIGRTSKTICDRCRETDLQLKQED